MINNKISDTLGVLLICVCILADATTNKQKAPLVSKGISNSSFIATCSELFDIVVANTLKWWCDNKKNYSPCSPSAHQLTFIHWSLQNNMAWAQIPSFSPKGAASVSLQQLFLLTDSQVTKSEGPYLSTQKYPKGIIFIHPICHYVGCVTRASQVIS